MTSYTYSDMERLAAKVVADNPINDPNFPDRADPMAELRAEEAGQATADREAEERAENERVLAVVQKSMHADRSAQPRERLSDGTDPNDVVSRIALINTINDEREHTMKTVVEPLVREMDDLKRELDQCRAREKLSEDRLRALEERCVRAETRVAKLEDRAFSSASGLSAYAGNTAH
jgi:hypothetical protein